MDIGTGILIGLFVVTIIVLIGYVVHTLIKRNDMIKRKNTLIQGNVNVPIQPPIDAAGAVAAAASTPAVTAAVAAAVAPPAASGSVVAQTAAQIATICSDLATKYGIIPNVTWGSADAAAQASYISSDCNTVIKAQTALVAANVAAANASPDMAQITASVLALGATEHTAQQHADMCMDLANKYHVVPNGTWGTADAATQAIWTTGACNQPVIDRTAKCMDIANTFGIIPGVSWGSADAVSQGAFTAFNCNQPVVANCDYAKKAYGYQPGVSWGTIPEAYKAWVTC